MEILAYGEDALTLWALKSRLGYILQKLDDSSNPAQCQAFFRPSFGRRGGKNSSQFGEFDFILLTANHVYLGESKWDNSSEKIIEGKLELREEQLLRHKLFTFYIQEWAFGTYKDNEWQKFANEAKPKLIQENIEKPIAPPNSLLAKNLRTTLKLIRRHYENTGQPEIRNVLLYFHKNLGTNQLPQKAGNDFEVVSIDYSEELTGKYISL
jgi:hypothetical protein